MNKRRPDELEDALGPKEAVLHWMDEAHTFGSLPAYVESLIDRPVSEQPFVALPRRVADAAWAQMRGERTTVVKTAMDEAIADTVFLLRLVIGLNVHVEESLRVESLRHAALYWWSRALDPDRRAEATLPPDWHAGVANLVGWVRGGGAGGRSALPRRA